MAVNKNLPQATIAEYVAGAKDMETRLFVLKKIKTSLDEKKETLKKKNKTLETEYEQKSKSWKLAIDGEIEGLKKLREKCHQIIEQIKNPPPPPGKFYLILTVIFLGIIGGGLIGLLIKWIFSLTFNSVIISILVASVLIILLLIIPDSESEDEKRLKIENLEKVLAEGEKKHHETISLYEDKLKSAEDALTLNNSALLTIDSLISNNDTSISQISNALTEYYQAGIIPPDYRNAACVEIIDYVFRNDQADTMREATLLCNQYQWHGELMDVLHELGSVMVGINNTLNDINNNISALSADIEELASGQREIAKESKLARYAAESSAKSAEYMEWRVRNHIT